MYNVIIGKILIYLCVTFNCNTQLIHRNNLSIRVCCKLVTFDMLKFVILVLVAFSLKSAVDVSAIVFGPTDITRREGEDDVVFICPSIESQVPIWKINDCIYGVTNLPHPFLAAYDNLLILFVDLSMDQFTFQCFIHSDKPGPDVSPSTIGRLNVPTVAVSSEVASVCAQDLNEDSSFSKVKIDGICKSSSSIPPTMKVINPLKLKINHNLMDIMKDSCTLSWHYSQNQDNNNNCTFSNVLFRIRGWTCLNSDQAIIWEKNITKRSEVKLHNGELIRGDESVTVTIEAISKRSGNNPRDLCTYLQYGI